MHSHDLEMLLREYANATTPEDQLIQMELSNIATLMQRSRGEEWQFSNAVCNKFCQIIRLLQSRHEKEMQEPRSVSREEYGDVFSPFAASAPRMGFVPLNPNLIPRDPEDFPWDFETGEDLLRAFYNAFRTSEQQGVDYLEIPEISRKISRMTEELQHMDGRERELYRQRIDEERRTINSTIKDYAARIKTFATARPEKQYLAYMDLNGLLGDLRVEGDPILFTFEHIELILARFDTKADGQINKQKSNISSALRKLNQFKREL